MKNRIVNFVLISLILLLFSCTPMDYKYKEFIEDGPITYLAKLNPSEVRAIGGRNRVRIVIPKQADPRGVKAELFWANKRSQHTEAIDPGKETSFYIDNLAEASYIFEISILDEEGNSSIPVAISANVYGNIWETYIPNRIIINNVPEEGGRKISFENNVDRRLIGCDFEWKQDGIAIPFQVSVDSSQTTAILENFSSKSFRYRTRYIPEAGGEDIFYSLWEYYVENIDVKLIDFDKKTTTFTMPTPNDGFWSGYEFTWTDKSTGELKSQVTNTNVISLQNYNAMSVNYKTLYTFDEILIPSTGIDYSTVQYVDLDRSNWYIAPETRISDGSAINSNSEVPVAEKNKSPYLSHLLFYAASGSDGQIAPWSHIDGNENTYLAMIKGYGTTLENNRNKTGTLHSFGGVSSDGNDIYWIVDLGNKQNFNYYRLVYRNGQANGNLKPQKFSLYGSNDPDCINDQEKWEVIREGIVPPGSDQPSNNSDPNHIGRTTGNQLLPESSFRYIKFRYDGWTDASNSMAIAEFYLGLYN